ncbi:hypothetical protein DL766_006333 [Monosporascus sp. MC13-8B]|uniref:Glycine-rich domain-containing protein 1 n=1 Tax=Monosporascus cannonballus TaxID=155416 RepID=A0ABY0H234_9PEZI|nr:hypothetical protein DL762_006589 [Monosporascus cannonballus]RYO90174.1 hypothetical protein DL763_005415 [Monosporascus cannonballus]RYP27549.1 hypothetical protein DL766_006333 [Monosporascus sp. MC13-8B]
MSAPGGALDGGTAAKQERYGLAPPAYTPVDNGTTRSGKPNNATLTPETVAELNSAFSSLNLPASVADVSPDSCIAHLKLLSAFQYLKEDVGYTDGLWQLFDSRALPPRERPCLHIGRSDEEARRAGEDWVARTLAMLREKRWALYVARAVDRYEAWWESFSKNPLTEADMENDDQSKYSEFTDGKAETPFEPSMLPPVDVLLVWHAHMLNPRAYLEDCLRNGLKELWTLGIPWNLVNAAIDDNFNYDVSNECKIAWETNTGRKWNNMDDDPTKTLKCPICKEIIQIPWTTCGEPEHTGNPSRRHPGLEGNGYGDGNLEVRCPGCCSAINRQLLEFRKFVKDFEGLMAFGQPMPGTILSIRTGLPTRIPRGPEGSSFPQTFPNRLLKKHLNWTIIDLVRRSPFKSPSMEDVRQALEISLNPNNSIVSMVDGQLEWQSIDWLHSPAARETMTRLIRKYRRFTNIMARHPDHIVVPTLDIDLAWHTQQLTPRVYFDWMVKETEKFIDHDDRIDEVKLTCAFEWTSKTYQEEYKEVYSECTCWYCESIRASHASSLGKLLGISKNQKVSDSFHDTRRANLCPPDASAHISAHSSVRLDDVSSLQAGIRQQRLLRMEQHLEENYRKAQKRAQEKGRKLPPLEEYRHDHWGYPFVMYGPWAYPIYMTPEFYACDPGRAVAGTGAAGACVGGTCGGGAAAGACTGADAGGWVSDGGCGSYGGTSGSCGGGAMCGGGGRGGGGVCGGGGGGGGCGGGGGGGG